MPRHLSDQEMKRIAEFVDTPVYEREPEQLLPDDAVEDAD